MSSGTKDNSNRGALRRQRLRPHDSGGVPAGGSGWHPSPRQRPFFGPSSDDHADAPRELLERQVSSRAYLAALSLRSVTPPRASPTTSVSAVQSRIKLLVRHAVVLLLYTVECLRQPASWCVSLMLVVL